MARSSGCSGQCPWDGAEGFEWIAFVEIQYGRNYQLPCLEWQVVQTSRRNWTGPDMALVLELEHMKLETRVVAANVVMNDLQ